MLNRPPHGRLPYRRARVDGGPGPAAGYEGLDLGPRATLWRVRIRRDHDRAGGYLSPDSPGCRCLGAGALPTERVGARPGRSLVHPRVRVPCARRLRALRHTACPHARRRRSPVRQWDQDATAADRDYGGDVATDVSAALFERAIALADRFDSVGESDWSRPGSRSDGAHFTVESFGVYLVHDPAHHLWDIRELARE